MSLENFDHLVLKPQKRGIGFRCPVCGNVAYNDAGMEPMCTGPRWTDDHEPHVMKRLPSEKLDVWPEHSMSLGSPGLR